MRFHEHASCGDASDANDCNGNGISDACETGGDANGDGGAEFQDLLIALSTWGPRGDPCHADFDCSGAVDFADLPYLLSTWGPCV